MAQRHGTEAKAPGPPTFGELLARADVAEQVQLRSRFGFLAFHGGLEAGTETIAERAAALAGASLYTVVQPASLRWHVPSHRVSPVDSPALAAFLAHVHVAVTVHGYGREARWRQILCGGGNRALAARVATALRLHVRGFTVVDDLDAIPRELRGVHPDNPVNRPAHGGVQLELPPRARGAVPCGGDASFLPVPGLVASLAHVAAAWA